MRRRILTLTLALLPVLRVPVSGDQTEFLIGIAHPLAPYRLHFS